MKRRLLQPLLASLIAWLAKALYLSLKKHRPAPSPTPSIYAVYHGEVELLLAARPKGHFVVLTSQSQDGQLLSSVLRRFGVETIPGSSSRRGATGLRKMIRAIKEGKHVVVAIDGSRGPKHQVQPGVLQLSKLTGAPILPTRAFATRSWQLNSWDDHLIPKPFARVSVKSGEHLRLSKNVKRKELESHRLHLERKLQELDSST